MPLLRGFAESVLQPHSRTPASGGRGSFHAGLPQGHLPAFESIDVLGRGSPLRAVAFSELRTLLVVERARTRKIGVRLTTRVLSARLRHRRFLKLEAASVLIRRPYGSPLS